MQRETTSGTRGSLRRNALPAQEVHPGPAQPTVTTWDSASRVPSCADPRCVHDRFPRVVPDHLRPGADRTRPLETQTISTETGQRERTALRQWFVSVADEVGRAEAPDLRRLTSLARRARAAERLPSYANGGDWIGRQGMPWAGFDVSGQFGRRSAAAAGTECSRVSTASGRTRSPYPSVPRRRLAAGPHRIRVGSIGASP
jgi:hypothetical protein